MADARLGREPLRDPLHAARPAPHRLPASLLLRGRPTTAAYAPLGIVDQEEGRAADLIVATQHQVRDDGALTPGLFQPRHDEHRGAVEQNVFPSGVVT